MKRSILAVVCSIMAGVVLALGLGACTLFQHLPTLQEQVATQCTIVNGDLAVIGASPLLNVDQQKLVMEKILPANKAVCSGVATLNVNVADIKALHDSLLPAVVTIVQGLPTFPNQTAILLGLNTFGPLLQQEVDQIITAIAAKQAASAPVAASQ